MEFKSLTVSFEPRKIMMVLKSIIAPLRCKEALILENYFYDKNLKTWSSSDHQDH